MDTAIQMLETMVGAALATEPMPTPARIRELILHVRGIPLCSSVSDENAEKLALHFESQHGVSMSIGSMLKEREYEPWLASVKADIDPYYWDRYKKLLVENKFSGQVIATLDNVTDRTLGLLANPEKKGYWDRRGMVVGHVQSGKTANYSGLICKAADAGYKLIIVIAGIHNNLRNQTQLRIDEGFVGRDSSRLLSNKDSSNQKFIGVGKYDKTRRPVTFTNSLKDFNKGMATGIGIPLQNLNEPAVFVIKKNTSTLKNLIEWLKEHNAKAGNESIDAPMLLIDDEADNASINISKGKDEVSRINGQIRELLKIFDRSCYVGYTATPFANIFIDPDDDLKGADLFPRDFIVSLDPPTNYFGATRVFQEDPDKIIRHINDNENILPIKHKKDHPITALPQSLEDAVRTYLVAIAVRLVRGHLNKHSSMLVNASRFTDVQRQLRNEIHSFVDIIRSSVRVNGNLPSHKALRDPEINALYEIWSREYEREDGISWDNIQDKLHESIAPVNVVEVNSRSSGSLNYADHEKTGLNIIAVGGFSLSRGLTLEGLMVSYFLRNSLMYDTLMQMGRWFGYRPGYDDLCRVWMPEEAEGWYAHITESIEELREELRKMEVSNATPEEFGLKVKSHPDSLIVTARNKMGSGEKVVVSIGLANRFIETATLKDTPSSLLANRNAANQLAKSLSNYNLLDTAKMVKGGFLINGTPASVITNFISAFDNHRGSLLTDTIPVKEYIEDRIEGELANWDILFTSLQKKEPNGLFDDEVIGLPINCQRRSKGRRNGDEPTTLRITNKQRVSSRGIEKIGLTEEQVKAAEAAFIKTKSKESESFNPKSINYPDRAYRSFRSRPLLIIHLLAIGKEDEDLTSTTPVVAWSISFPGTELEEKKAEYIVTSTWLREHFGQDIEDELTEGDDDE